MTGERWAEVDEYISERLLGETGADLAGIVESSVAAGLPPINVAPNQGAMLMLLARIAGARRVLEVGTLGGYSTAWLAQALPADGRLVSLELDQRHAEVARANLSSRGLGDVVDIRVGRALDLLPGLLGEPAFDLVFIDADKPGNASYVQWALRLSRPGTVIVVDNVVRDGAVVERASEDPNVLGTRALFDLVADEPRLTATAVQTVGVKGYDGFLLAVVDQSPASG